MKLIEEFINNNFYDPVTKEFISYAGPSGERFVIDEHLIHCFVHIPTRNNNLLDAIFSAKLRDYQGARVTKAKGG